MDNVGDSLSPRGLFLFREHYYPKKPNLSKIFSIKNLEIDINSHLSISKFIQQQIYSLEFV